MIRGRKVFDLSALVEALPIVYVPPELTDEDVDWLNEYGAGLDCRRKTVDLSWITFERRRW